jgi:hypothetical protein
MAYVTIKSYPDPNDQYNRSACNLQLNEETDMYVFERIQLGYHGAESTVPIPMIMSRDVYAKTIELSYFDELASNWIATRPVIGVPSDITAPAPTANT